MWIEELLRAPSVRKFARPADLFYINHVNKPNFSIWNNSIINKFIFCKCELDNITFNETFLGFSSRCNKIKKKETRIRNAAGKSNEIKIKENTDSANYASGKTCLNNLFKKPTNLSSVPSNNLVPNSACLKYQADTNKIHVILPPEQTQPNLTSLLVFQASGSCLSVVNAKVASKQLQHAVAVNAHSLGGDPLTRRGFVKTALSHVLFGEYRHVQAANLWTL